MHDDATASSKKVLKVETTSDGYLQTYSTGENIRFVRALECASIGIGELALVHEVDLEAGNLHPVVHGRSPQHFYVIGNERAFQIDSAEIRSCTGNATAKCVEKYLMDGRLYHADLKISIPEAALRELVSELKSSEVRNFIVIECIPSLFFQMRGTTGEWLCLPPRGEHSMTKTWDNFLEQDTLVSEWQFNIGKVRLVPAASFFGKPEVRLPPAEFERTIMKTLDEIKNELGGLRDIKDELGGLRRAFESAAGEIGHWMRREWKS